MNNQSLAVKYRPRTFDDGFCEQSNTVKILREQIITKKIHRSYIFSGASGCGKTTAARIFVYELNGNMGGIIEVDAASNSGVENVRELKETAQYKSLDSEYKVMIIDEAHSLSSQAWQAFLKLIEEPPSKTVFIFCTTEFNKIPKTILSRCQHFTFNRLSFDAIVDRLDRICECEKIVHYDAEALKLIAKMADGGMRTAITSLEKCLSFSRDISVQTVISAMGDIEYDIMFALLENIILCNQKEAIQIIEEIYRSGVDIKAFSRQLNYFILDVLKYDLFSDFKYINIPSIYEAKLKSSNIRENIKFVHKMLDDIVQLNSDIKWSVNPLSMIECQILNWSRED